MLYTCDELFFSGTAVEITPIRSVDRIPVADGRPGPITRRLQEEFNGIVRGTLPDRHGWLSAVAPVAAAAREASRSCSMNINDLLKIAVERKASDLHLKVGQPSRSSASTATCTR